ncbi:metallophosphoesterase family protein [Tessaracoccus caeni]|uniref:metallophosphoesterase family protein n=1 Tax=Tessaracoccus caeni TaxID=3031239 RepID=UPI0023DBE409|nr:metallophosphoesterase family protein [Tessaracoccus caeni]MDF1489543.1 metallophosphoesterase family protein [Tessaracoccus caeni]
MRYFTSDTHFGHQNIIKFCNRPYTSVDHMNLDLVKRITERLEPDDELWHLGDVALGRLDDTLVHLACIAVDVTLVAGNHDRCHPYNGARAEGFVDYYRERCGLAALIQTNTALTLSNGLKVKVSHFPYADPSLPAQEDRHGKIVSDKFAPWRPIDDGSWLLCGHVHDSWRQRGRMINVGIDAWAGRPLSEEEIIDVISAGPQDLDALPW